MNTERNRYLPSYCNSYDELRDIFDYFHIDGERTRFFVGHDYYEPKAFVIVRDFNGEFEVYKRKADGSKAVRYRGNDEKFAVSQFYQKFLEEVSKRPEFAEKLLGNTTKMRVNGRERTYPGENKLFFVQFFLVFASFGLMVLRIVPFWTTIGLFLSVNPGIFIWLLIFRRFPPKWYSIICILLLLGGGMGYNAYNKILHRNDGYYSTYDKTYYRQGNDMYRYDDDDWRYYGTYDTFDNYYDDYRYYDTYEYNEDYSDFKYSNYHEDYDYDDYSSNDYSSSSSDSDWSSSDWDSWDSSDSDWDSDW